MGKAKSCVDGWWRICSVTLLVTATGAILMGCATNGNTQVAGSAQAFDLRKGDLLFRDSDCGPLCEAIETVTTGAYGANFSHVGMVARIDADGHPVIIEAVNEGVVETPLDAFLARSGTDADGNPKVAVGRLEPSDQRLIPDAVTTAESFLGLPYDPVYVIGNDSFYCSELVYECFRQANGGTPLYELEPMTFKDPATGTTFPAWEDYYQELGEPIPEGEPGLNPGGISDSPALRLVHLYGLPSGYQGPYPLNGPSAPSGS